jgi:hypothetical protein
MNPSEQFRKHAAECQDMAKFARSRESKATWGGLAARWVLCAELTERQLSASTLHRVEKQHRRPRLSRSHRGGSEAV